MTYQAILFRTILAVIIGGLIGMERQNKQRPAGFKTHILVCLGSATIMMLSALLFEQYYEKYQVYSDPARLGAQVISGVGFLGAGTIIHSGPNVRGLTTAASLWAVAAVGLVIGAGFYSLAITVTIALYLTLIIFNKISEKFEKTNNVLEVVVKLTNKPKVLGTINMILAKSGCKIIDMQFYNNNSDSLDILDNLEVITIQIALKLENDVENHEILSALSSINGVLDVKRI